MNRLPESAKPQTIRRRLLQGFLPLTGVGLDVGAGTDEFPAEVRQWWRLVPGMEACRVVEWDRRDGDAHHLRGVPDASYDWLFSSHCLEHLENPTLALFNWLRVVRPGGKLLISVPHRQLYEQRLALPSRWNQDHKRFYLPFESDGPYTAGLVEWLGCLPPNCHEFSLAMLATGDWGHTNTGTGAHPDGEYCIDALLVRS
jgi:SAM-dependent methyltransferase